MSRRKKIKILIPVVLLLLFYGYSRHRQENKINMLVGHFQARDLDEISGIAASGLAPSGTNADLYYVHNDSGDTSRFFSILPDGTLKSTIYFKGDPREKQGVNDCEDIAVGPGPIKGKSYVYLGDIGDNHSNHPYITVYRMEENPMWVKDTTVNTPADAIHLKYPEGPRDAETLMVDPVERLIYIVTKRRDSVTVYTSPLDFKPNDTLFLTKRCNLFFAGYKVFKWITAGDISKDGKQVLLKNYSRVYYWKRENDEPIWKTLKRKPQILPYKQEKQGEAIGFTPDGKGYYTTSEGVYAPIYYYKIPGE
ncbi:MAG TPA: hypothetical protein VGN20_03070 [Mucilaginibacter sp.]|jgi:hypothetical protein